MSPIEITINGKTFKMIFNLKVFRSLGKDWGLETLDEVVEKVKTIDQLSTGKLSAFETFFDIIHESINCCKENSEKISREDIEDLSMEDMKLLASSISAGTAEGFNVQEDPEKKTKPKKLTK